MSKLVTTAFKEYFRISDDGQIFTKNNVTKIETKRVYVFGNTLEEVKKELNEYAIDPQKRYHEIIIEENQNPQIEIPSITATINYYGKKIA